MYLYHTQKGQLPLHLSICVEVWRHHNNPATLLWRVKIFKCKGWTKFNSTFFMTVVRLVQHKFCSCHFYTPGVGNLFAITDRMNGEYRWQTVNIN